MGAADAAGVNATPTDAQIQEAYHAYVTALPAREYHVAHILVATGIVAQAVVVRLDKGERFDELARQASADDSGARGGDLGWIVPGHLPDAFVKAVQTLKVGQYARKPVKTPYGWHVIKLLESRASNAPALDAVRAQLIQNIKAKRYQEFLDASIARIRVSFNKTGLGSSSRTERVE